MLCVRGGRLALLLQCSLLGGMLFLAIGSSVGSPAQNGVSDPTTGQIPGSIRSESHVVLISVAVRDAAGQTVRDLRKEDFTVTDNGNPRDFLLFPSDDSETRQLKFAPNFFSNRYGAAAPRVTAILLDSTNTAMADQSYAREQAIKALQTIPLDTRVGIYALSVNLKILQDYTTDRDLLLKALNDYTPSPPLGTDPSRSSSGPYSAEHGGAKDFTADSGRGARLEEDYYRQRRIDLTLATLLTIATHITGASHRNSIIWITDGVPLRSDDDSRFQRALDAINDANIALYPIDARGLSPDPHAAVDDLILDSFAHSTGGQAFYNHNDLDRAIAQAMAAPRFTYLLGFYLTQPDLDGRFHKLRVSVDKPGVSLSYRTGYTASINPNDRRNNKEPLDEELLATQDSSDVGIDARLAMVNGRGGKPALNISFALDRTTIAPPQAGHGSKLTFLELFAETDARGQTVARITESISFDMPEPNHDAGFTQSIPLQAGAENLKIVIQQKESGRTGSLTIPLAKVAAN